MSLNTTQIIGGARMAIIPDADYYLAKAGYYFRAAQRTRSEEERQRLTSIALLFETRARSLRRDP